MRSTKQKTAWLEALDSRGRVDDSQSWQGSVDSQLDLLSLQGAQERKPSLSRSLTDSNITYQGDEMQEAVGATCYITKEGDIDFQVVLKVNAIAKYQNL